MSHALLPLTAAAVTGRQRVPRNIALTGAALAMLPDADVIGFRLGVTYGDDWGHRGASHSLLFAALVTMVLLAVWPAARSRLAACFLYFSTASHGLLDTLTNGGMGVALFWPFDTTRYFALWHPILVAPIGARFFTARGIATLLAESRWIWLPCLLIAGSAMIARRQRQPGLATLR
jgi:inner membrane protein